MGTVELSSDQLRVEGEITEAASYDIVDAARDTTGDRFQLYVETEEMSFLRPIGTEAARAVFDRLTATDDADMAAFVADLTEIQTAFLRTLVAADDPVASTPLRERMHEEFDVEVSPRALGGSIQGIHSKSNARFGERIQTANWLDGPQEFEYYVKEPYVQPLRDALAEED